MGLFEADSVTKLKVLDIDSECRPLSYMGQDYTSGEITSIACSWIDSETIDCWLLGEMDLELIIRNFKVMYDQADIITGHYIKGHDLPLINAACLELGLDPLGSKLVQDTYSDLVKRKYLSGSQESLSAMYNLSEAKHHMDQPSWRRANRLEKEGLKLTKKRVIDDVKQHKELRLKLLENNALRAPKKWSP